MPPAPILLESFDSAPASILEAVDAGLEEYNHSVAPLAEVRQLVTVARTDDGRLAGGAVGRTWGRCCELLQLWVSAERRHQGLGSMLLREFESRGRDRGCDVFYLTTLSYQAPAFYLRHGYRALAEIKGYPDGIVKYLMLRGAA